MMPENQSRPGASGFTMPNVRWWIIAPLIVLSTTLNHLDRNVLSTAAPVLQKTLGFGELEYSWILNSFMVAYMLMHLGVGRIIDCVGSRIGPRARSGDAGSAERLRPGRLQTVAHHLGQPAAAPGWPVSSALVIGELVTGGASASDEYLELYNKGDTTAPGATAATSAGPSRRARRAQKPSRRMSPWRWCSVIRSRVIRKPLRTKNISTPNGPFMRSNPKW